MSSHQQNLWSIAAFAVSSVLLMHISNASRRKMDSKLSSNTKTSPKKEGTPKKIVWTVEDEVNNTLRLPAVDLTLFLNKEADPAKYSLECAKVADALHKYGVCIVKDPRVAEADNFRFLDMMERYFEVSDGIRDARPEYAYQVGVTPELTGTLLFLHDRIECQLSDLFSDCDFLERPRNHCARMGAYGPDNKPLSPCPPELDPKWRFFWRIGPTPKSTNFPFLNAEMVLPPEFPEWKDVMDMWGYKMLNAVFGVAEMAAKGFGMPENAFTQRMDAGPHLLAPTGSDYKKYGELGTVLAGYHYDLNFLTIHGKSRFPGLNIWTREGKKMAVAVPDGCLLVQAGKQFEMLTGGYIMAGFHEVVISPLTENVINTKKQSGGSLWRVSSTLFGHIQSDQVLEPLPPFNTPDACSKYPPVFTGNMV